MPNSGPPIIPGASATPPSQPSSGGVPARPQNWWAKLNPAPKVLLILAGVGIGLCIAPASLVAIVAAVSPSQVDAPAVVDSTSSQTRSTSVATASTTTPAPVLVVTTTTTTTPPPPPPPTTAAAQPPPPPPPPTCDPNYSGACVPIARDVDCAGGSGDGPAYVRGPVQVIGRDIYGLDTDHDGIGCE